ncbi:MAG TPA: lipid-A-disaccharide synthase [Candidatus Dormibacteraeota bacterium]|nr:lipid-A-disaccharide synthase [Candidatus Dormibacteraeota bacterium]
MTPTPILVSAGEVSGDMYAARLAKALQQRANVSLFGLGGTHMHEAGVELVADNSEVAVVGISEVFQRLPVLRRAMRRLVFEAERRKPPLAVLVDFPGFHLRLARKLRRRGIRNVYFVCPQFWAWRPWRARLVRRRFAQALCIFPFEEEFYRDAGVRVQFIGHPLVGEVKAGASREEFFRAHHLDHAIPLVTLLPGSRPGELRHHLPVLAEACRLLHHERPIQFVVAAAPGMDMIEWGASLSKKVAIEIVAGATYDALAAADVAVVSSGTATIETALLDTPMVVVYRLSRVTAFVAKPLVRTPFFAMVNLVAGRQVVPELIQKDFTPQRLASEVSHLLDSAAARDEMRRGLAMARARLGPPGAVERAAEIIARMI